MGFPGGAGPGPSTANGPLGGPPAPRGCLVDQDDALSADFPSQGGGWEAGFSSLCYAPLVLWGPLLAVLAVAYGKRRLRARG